MCDREAKLSPALLPQATLIKLTYIKHVLVLFLMAVSHLFSKLHLLTLTIKEFAIQSKSKWLYHLIVDPKEQSL